MILNRGFVYVSYIKIDDMNIKNGIKVEKVLKSIQSKNVILDMRQNYGGRR